MDLLSVALGIGVGALAGVVLTYLAVRPAKKLEQPVAPTLPLEKLTAKATLIEKAETERARREMKTLLLEKELLSAALTRVYEAEAEGAITKEQREQLSVKYRDQLKAVNQKLSDVEALIEVGELENLHKDLVNLFEQKIGAIEARLNQAKAKLEAIRGPLPAMPLEQAPEVVEKKFERKKPREESEVEAKVKALRDEVMEALARLEQMDLES